MDKQSRKMDRWWDLPAIITMLVMLMLVNGRLIVTDWTSHLKIIQLIILLGFIAGLTLGYTIFSSKIVPIFTLVYGAFIITWMIGLTIGTSLPWTVRLNSIWTRLILTINFLVQRKPVPDNLLFLFLMSLLFWIISIFSGYSLLRKAESWRLILPAGITLVIIHSYDLYYPRRILYLMLYLFLSLVLVARLYFLHNKKIWKNNHTYLPPDLGMDIYRFTMIGVIALLLVAWIVPTSNPTWRSAVNLWADIKKPFQGIRDSFDNAFASLKSSMGIENDYYHDSLNLGLGNRLSDTELFTVLTPSEPPQGKNYYWKVRGYDQYLGGKWSTTQNSYRLFLPEDQEIQTPNFISNTVESVPFYFTIYQPVSLLYIPAPPQWISHAAKIEVVLLDDGTLDIGSIQATPILRRGDTYSVRLSLRKITKIILRNTDSNYPKWVTDRYLQLPDTITPRVHQLATDLTKDQDNPFDKVQAITDYLRQNIEYVEMIPELPSNQEPIDWLLFDYKKGFCNYYASAEVIMLRSIGIPARLAAGYAQGESVGNINTFLVRQRDAHAWPEVFFTNVGWIEFEPTASRPELVYPSGEPLSNDFVPPIEKIKEFNPEEKQPDNRPQTNPILQKNKQNSFTMWFIIILGIASLFLIFYNFYSKQHQNIKIPLPVLIVNLLSKLGIQAPIFLAEWAFKSSLPEVTKSYLEINYALKRLNEQTSRSKTPIERGNLLVKVIPELNLPSQTLVQEYNLTVYSQQKNGNIAKARKAGSTIRNLSVQRWLRNLVIKSR